MDVTFGDFAENIATSGINWQTVPIGTIVHLGESVRVEITQIGKECHNKCAIYYLAGGCIMPKEGIFGRVLKGGAKTREGLPQRRRRLRPTRAKTPPTANRTSVLGSGMMNPGSWSGPRAKRVPISLALRA